MIDSLKVERPGYALYSDSRLDAARAMGIAFQVSRTTRTAMRGFGIDLAKASGEDHGQLPVPSVFLVAAGGEILWVYSNPDYKVRPDNEAVLGAARAAAAAPADSADADRPSESGAAPPEPLSAPTLLP